ncbi:MAG: RNA polymerase sigma factor [Acidimicrobiales bacterium]
MRRVRLPVEQLPDEALLASVGRGDDEMTVAFVRRFQNRVFGVAWTIVGDPGIADDVSQHVLERAWRHASTFDARRGSVSAWLMTIKRNLAIDAVRVRRPAPVDPAELLLQVSLGGDAPERQILSAEVAEDMRKALSRLPPEQARALVLSGLVGMSASEVACAEGIPLGTAKTRIRTAMGRMRVLLALPAGGGAHA